MLIFFFSILGHLVGDFALQTKKQAINKAFLNWYMLSHCLLVSATTVAPFFLVTSIRNVLLIYAIIFVSHIAADNVKKFIIGCFEDKRRFWAILALDQIFHIFIIYLMFMVFAS